MFQTTPDDRRIEEMDPVQKLWMYQNWLADYEEKTKILDNHAYLLASFDHPQKVKDLLDTSNKHISTDEEFEETLKMIREESLSINNEPKKKKKRKKIKG